MGFLEHFLPPASKDAFAHKVMSHMKKRRAKGPFLYNREEFWLKVGEAGTTLYLANAYDEYCKAKFSLRDKVIRKYVEQVTGGGAAAGATSKLPGGFEEAKEKMLPRVRERFFYESLRLSFAGQGKPVPELPRVNLTEDLAVNLVYDAPDSVAMVDAGVLSKWKVEFEEAMKIARVNLWKISNENFEEVSPGLFVGVWKDNHAASRMFLHDLIWQLPVKGGKVGEGGHVVMVPNRDTLLVAGVEDEAALSAMAVRVEEALKDPRFMTGLAVILKGSGWEPFMPAQGSVARGAFEKLRMLTFGNWYGGQKKLLETGNQANGAFVANYTLATTPEGKMLSFATWGEGLDGLLPEVQWIGLMGKPGVTGKPKMYGFLPLEKAVAAWPGLVEKTEMYPARWRTKGFPTEEQIAAVGMVNSPTA